MYTNKMKYRRLASCFIFFYWATLCHAVEMAVVFDASESMCGYLSHDDKSSILPTLIKIATTLDSDKDGVKTYLLKQSNKKKADPTKDLIVAPDTLLSKVEELSSKSGKKGKACSPMNGVASELSLVFSQDAPFANSDMRILITDAQFDETSRKAFLSGLEHWLNKKNDGGNIPYVGFALTTPKFTGLYYPIGGGTAISLQGQPRPLLLFWFASSAKHMEKLNQFIAVIRNPQLGVVQHLLPFEVKDGSIFKDEPFFSPTLLKSVEWNKAKVTPELVNSSRSKDAIRNCIKIRPNEDVLQLRALSKCSDQRPIFEQVRAITVTIPLKETPISQISAKPDFYEKEIIFSLSSADLGKAREIPLFQFFKSDPLAENFFSQYTTNSDSCASLTDNAAGKTCQANLAAKTFQLDILIRKIKSISKAQQKIIFKGYEKGYFKLDFSLTK